ncbi:hypothetical protein ACFPFP_09955 [Bradyrhizobium sp. GCM10023182]|uniref:Uncharacterized protein n=1 Tax=Bradyrhizobium zhengyangense TaxID=2911009 RepID=A0ABS9LKA9_9BRAD|nr:hypothetical protein [Bradyrhizobium zhengyangense]MCG2667268.1 hypothetical protein [Bradyrhizobium zhengyangense]
MASLAQLSLHDPAGVPILPRDHFGSDAVEWLHDTPPDSGMCRGTNQQRRLHRASCDDLRIATIGYNVSFEKPVVVRHDQLFRSIRPIFDDDRRNGG